MLALGKFAGVAHELNNHLTGVLGFAEIIANSRDGQPNQAMVSELRMAAERAATLAREMQALGRRPTVRQCRFDRRSDWSYSRPSSPDFQQVSPSPRRRLQPPSWLMRINAC